MTWGNNFKANSVADTYLKMKADAAAKVVTEKVEELDELSKKTLDSYVDKSDNDAKKHSEKSIDAWVKGDRKTADKHYSKMSDRSINIGKAIEKSKLTKEDLDDYSLEEIQEFMMSEEYEELDELSKASLGSYVKKSSASASGLATNAMHHQNTSDKLSAKSSELPGHTERKTMQGKASELARQSFDATEKQMKRQAGIGKAVSRLTKEDLAFELDEAAAKGHTIEAHGVKGMKSTPWRKSFKSGEHAYSWAEKNDAEVHGTRALDGAKKSNEDLDIFSDSELDMLINEVLKTDAPAGKWIEDFVKSDNPKFSGKSKEKRKQMALGAYYAKQRNEEVDIEEGTGSLKPGWMLKKDPELAKKVKDNQDLNKKREASYGNKDAGKSVKEETEVVKTSAKTIKHANIKDKRDDQDVMEPRAQGEKDFLAKLSVNATDEPAAKYKSGAGTIKQATKPVANGPGTYDAKNKLGFKEETDCKDLGDKEDSEKASGKGKSFFSFKEKMKKAK